MLIYRVRKPVLGAVGAAFVVGCMPSGFMITPVSTQRALTETELSRDSFFASDKIVLIDVSGTLSNSASSGWFGSGEHTVSLFVEQLDKARQDNRVKAAILRINSPGGTVVASELMHDEIVHFREESGKPVVAVLMDVAASGGYYIACACDEIVAQPSTVTGSIGVIMQTVDVTGTMKLIGVRTDAITTGNFKDVGSPLRAMRPEEREMFQGIVNEMYDRFVGVVVTGRPDLDEAEVRQLADGRIYTASQALEHGLIDRITTLRDVFELTKERVGSKAARLVTYHRPMDYRPNYYASRPQTFGNTVNLFNINLPGWLGGHTPRFMYLWAPHLTSGD